MNRRKAAWNALGGARVRRADCERAFRERRHEVVLRRLSQFFVRVKRNDHLWRFVLMTSVFNLTGASPSSISLADISRPGASGCAFEQGGAADDCRALLSNASVRLGRLRRTESERIRPLPANHRPRISPVL